MEGEFKNDGRGPKYLNAPKSLWKMKFENKC